MKSSLINEYFSKLADRWDDGTTQDLQKLRRVVDFCEIKPGSKVLDIACGTGVMFPFLLAKEPGRLLGVDICQPMVIRARSKFSDERLEVIEQDFFELNEKDFDCAVCYNSYPHFFNKEGFARKLKYVLKKGGRVVIAHGGGKEHINAVHKEKGAAGISTILYDAETEKKWFEPCFDIDILIDSDDIYVISGTKK